MQEILKKSQAIVEKTKLQAGIASRTVKIDGLYQSLGKLAYELKCECLCKNEEAAKVIVEIQTTELEIQALQDQIKALSNKVRCESCGEYFDADMTYCGHCGTKKVEHAPVEDEDEDIEAESFEENNENEKEE